MAIGKKTGGRKAGVPNKATADVKAAAQKYTNDALKTLAEIMGTKAQPAAARVSAAIALLDRAHGKPTQAVSGPDGGPIQTADASVFATLPKAQRDAVREALRTALA